MKLLFLVNDAGSPPGILHEEAEKYGADCDLILAPKASGFGTRRPREIPSASTDYDGIVVTGGVMSVNDEDQYPFIGQSRDLLRDFHASEKPVMGVCLGAQLLASAFHAPVYQMTKGDEWGFVPQRWTAAAQDDALLSDAEPDLAIVEWHSDTFDLPQGALHLGSSAACPHQAFRLGKTTYGFQFHLELTAGTLEKWTGLRAEAVGKSAGQIHEELGDVPALLARQQIFTRRVMRRWLDLCR